MKIQTTAVHFTADQKLLSYVDQKAGKLDHFFDRIIDASVFLKLENSGQVRDKIVELKLNVPGDTLVAKETSKTFEAAIDLVVDNMKRQIQRRKQKLSIRGGLHEK
ncbi:MAG TPA: ribosome-associated translation inhibitor RaiA [Saprospiraceae bacterium]|nr:ribosome-associated translation inhibitor RaiA [Saprospiraceae bacterium]